MITVTATLGSSAGAKPVNHAWDWLASRSFYSAEPVFPAAV